MLALQTPAAISIVRGSVECWSPLNRVLSCGLDIEVGGCGGGRCVAGILAEGGTNGLVEVWQVDCHQIAACIARAATQATAIPVKTP